MTGFYVKIILFPYELYNSSKENLNFILLLKLKQKYQILIQHNSN